MYITHYGLIANVALNQNKTGFSTLPVYHGYGHFSMYVSLRHEVVRDANQLLVSAACMLGSR